MSSVAIIACEQYNQNLVDRAIATVCTKANMPPVTGKTILLKPNILSDSKSELAITTHPVIVRAVIRHLKVEGAQAIYVGDSPGIHTSSFLPKQCGIYEVIVDEGVTWVDFTDSPIPRAIPYTRLKRLPMAKIIDEVDMIFSLPKLKTHQLMYATGAVKNLFGLVPNLNKSPMHVTYPTRSQFATLMVGIAAVAKPAFTIMDGIIALEGPGPANGTPTHLGLILASCDPVAVDWAQAKIMGYDPLEVPIVAEGIRRNLGSKPTFYPLLNAEDLVRTSFVRIAVDKKTHFIRSLILPLLFGPFIRWRVKRQRPAPVFLVDPCILCRKCIEICPVDALTMESRRIIIDEAACVRCYCCHEVCPADAIHIPATRRAQ
jgi:uncharacterized protein (DUF362 family)/NAD-dependent dihydropyrimidine dehydrogenase PreA subunit